MVQRDELFFQIKRRIDRFDDFLRTDEIEGRALKLTAVFGRLPEQRF